MDEDERKQLVDERQTGIGGSDAGALLGLNPYKTAVDVWREKKGLAEPVPDNPRMKAGRIMEGVLADWYAQETGEKVYRVNKMLTHNLCPYIIGHLDRRVAGPKVFEAKLTGRSIFRKWKSDGWTMPPWWYAQVQHYIAVSGWQSAVVAYCLDGSEYEYVPVQPDDAFIAAMINVEITFWTGNVLTNIPPEPVNADDVLKLFPRSNSDKVVDATSEIAQIVGQLRETEKRIKELEGNAEMLRYEVKKFMADADAVEYYGHRMVTWRSAEDSERFDTKRFRQEHPDLAAKYIKTSPGSRRFILKGEENEF